MASTSSLASGLTTMTTSIAATATTHLPSTTTTTHHATHTSGSSSGSSANSPLLFFVALGFGVVFTNLWIIVGVKYCFRYNSRQRQLRNLGEHGEPIDLGNVTGRPHRRRREKKLMSMEEVNERFPLIKYKLWRARREDEGLPAAGGVTAPPSRAASVLNHDGVVEPITNDDAGVPALVEAGPVEAPPGESKDFAPSGVATDAKTAQTIAITTEKPRLSIDNLPSRDPAGPANESPLSPGDVEEEDDDPIQQAVPSELLAQPGDACAICIDNLDDEDEVRGLTCGHAFHAGCLDPWLTSRRACCPLCKHDYYIPKPRAEPDANTDVNPTQQGPPEMPAPVWLSTFGATRFGRGPTSAYRARSAATRRGLGRPDVPSLSSARPQPAAAPEEDEHEPRSRFRVSLPSLSVPRILRRGHHSTDEESFSPHSNNASTSTNNSPTTPSQLEAGQRQ